MLRQFHKFPGIIAGILVAFLALSGAVLSVLPMIQRVEVPATPATPISIAQVAGRIRANYPNVEQIQKKPSGKIVAFYYVNDKPASVLIDPVTGKALKDYAPSGFERWVKNLHRSLLLGDKGRIIAGIGAAAMVLLCLSGVWLLVRRLGGWRRLFSRTRGPLLQRLHVELARIVVSGLLISSLTGIYMTLVTFNVLSDGMATGPMFPTSVNGGATIPVNQVTTLQKIDISQLRELVFPYAGDPTDVYTLSTSTGDGFIDQATGQLLSWEPLNTKRRIFEFIYMLHTGKGLWWMGLLLGLASLAVPIMAGSGTLIWWRKRGARPKIAHNMRPQHADTIILVGSEGGSTWSFAQALHDTLTKAGHKVHTGPMSALLPRYRMAERMFIFAATYGDGKAPQSAKGFLNRLARINTPPSYPVCVLGFGDRQFPQFCQFARDVHRAMDRGGWNLAMPFETIDRQSVQEFNRWGQALSAGSGENITLEHIPSLPRTHALTLISRSDYGAEVQAPTSILRFSIPRYSLWTRLTGRAMTRFDAGDLVAILPPETAVPRYYSLASSSRDGVLEICVRKQAGGLCSGFLHGLQPGDSIAAFIRPNPDFRPARGKAPVILIGAGTGVGPLAGFIRANKKGRPMYLYFGGRDPASDFLYGETVPQWIEEHRLTRATTAFSRVANRAYVQDAIRQDAETLRHLIRQGAQILVCGGREMASGVIEAMSEVLAPINLQPATLKAQGRYAEDVY